MRQKTDKKIITRDTVRDAIRSFEKRGGLIKHLPNVAFAKRKIVRTKSDRILTALDM